MPIQTHILDIPMKADAVMSLDELTAHLGATLPARMKELGVPGLSLALIREAEVAWLGAFGLASRASGQALTTDALLEAASLTKPAFACLVLQLWEEGRLDLDAPLIAYLPPEARTAPRLFDHVVNDPRLEALTARHVLSHQTGFRNWAPKGEPLRLELDPGSRFSYSGEGYVLLQRVLETLTGHTGGEMMQHRVLDPLGLAHSCGACLERDDLVLAQGHDEAGQPEEKWIPERFNAAYSLHCTPADFARFMAALMPSQGSRPALLRPETISEMLTPHGPVNDSAPWQEDWPRPHIQEESDVSWGLGWGLQSHPAGQAFWHWGDNGNFKAFALGIPAQGLGVVLMTNGKRGDRLWRELLAATIGGPFYSLDWLARVGEIAADQTS